MTRGPGRPPLPDTKRRQVRWDITLTIDEHTFLIARYPGDEKSKIISNLIQDVKRLDPEIQRAALTELREQLALKESELREQEDREREEQMQDEQQAREREDREHAKRLRSEAFRAINGKLNPWLDTVMPDAEVDVAAAVRRFASEEGITDESVVLSAIDSGERALARRRGYSRKRSE